MSVPGGERRASHLHYSIRDDERETEWADVLRDRSASVDNAARAVASILARASVASLEARYGPDRSRSMIAAEVGDRADELRAVAESYRLACEHEALGRWEDGYPHHPREMLNAARCFSYHARETGEAWYASTAAALILRAELWAIGELTRDVNGWPLRQPDPDRRGKIVYDGTDVLAPDPEPEWDNGTGKA